MTKSDVTMGTWACSLLSSKNDLKALLNRGMEKKQLS
jgi:hypothetical protein